MQKDETVDPDQFESLLCQLIHCKTYGASNPNTEPLISLNLSDLSLPTVTLLKVVSILSYNEKLESLNLSNNRLECGQRSPEKGGKCKERRCVHALETAREF